MEYKPLDVEKEILELWEKNRIYEKQKALGKRGPKFYWICGPPYTSGKFHIGHFWNYAALKDPFFRYKRMSGFDVWDRGGWDMHGLPTSRKVMAKLSLKTTEEVERYGLAKFIEECLKYSTETMEQMTKDYVRWGVWYDHKNAYQPIKQDFMEGVWWCVKKAWDNKLLYEGDKVMAWCPEAETVAAKHELEYKEVTDDSIYLKFKLKGKQNEYLIIWTTTPWTIPFNLAVMVNPEIDYAKFKVEGETWIIAYELMEAVSKAFKKDFELVEIIPGKKLEGLEYEPLLANEIPYLAEIKKKHKWAFKVLLSKEYVDLSAGTGLVHCAPGCGPEDQEVGNRYGLPAFNETDSRGAFSEKMGKFAGWVAKKEDKKFIEYFDQLGSLILKTQFKHEYPFHERTKCAVIFRTTKQWFFAVEKLKEKMLKWNKTIKWIPEWAGSKTFENWLENLKDIGITRQMFWGTPVPIWKCEACKHVEVFSSINELTKMSGKTPKNMHKPWIDEIIFKCPKCKKAEMKRIPDVCDVWLDAGCASWISLYFPQRKDLMKKYWPSDFILEAKDQIRGWFNLLFDAAAVSDLDCPFKVCYMTGWTNDVLGRKQSKSLGNVIDPYELVGKYGADAIRYYMMGSSQPGVDMNYNHKDAEIKFRNLGIFWNTGNFLLEQAAVNKIKDFKRKPSLDIEEEFILSKTHSTLKKVTELYDNYRLNEVPAAIEELFLALSRDYIKSVREKINFGDEKEKYAAISTIFESYLNILKMFSTVCPFITERMYQQLKQQFKFKEESIHLFSWPKAENAKIDKALENQYLKVSEAITAVLAARDKAKIGVRWPLQKAVIFVEDKEDAKADMKLKEIIIKQCNLKNIEVVTERPSWVKTHAQVNQAKLAPKFKEKMPKVSSKLFQLSPNAVQQKLAKEGKLVLESDGETFEILREEIDIVEETPKDVVGVQFASGSVYLFTAQNKELMEEGMVRELIRKVQSMRKTAGMRKQDKAKVSIAADKSTVEMLKNYVDELAKRTGSIVKLSTAESTSEKLNEKIEIKEKEILVGLSPV